MPFDNSPDSPSEAQGAVLTPGKMLRAAREAKGMHLAMLAVTLKVPVKQLEALESDQYDAFRGPTFVRAVAQSMCRCLGIDAAPVLAGLPPASTSIQVPPSTIASPVRSTTRLTRSGRGLGLSRQVMVLGVLMLCGSAALIWWPYAEPEPARALVVDSPLLAASEAEVPTPVIVPSVPEASSSLQVPPVAPLTMPSAPTLAASAAVASQASAASASSAARKSDMQIVATGDTWLEVRDARGQLVVNRLLKAGETQGVDVPAPFSVMVGRAHLVKVTQGGKNFDLTPHTKASTARFDIQP